MLSSAVTADDFPRAVEEYEAIDKILAENGNDLSDLSCFDLVLGDRGTIRRSVTDLKMAVDLAAQQVCSYWCEKKYGYLLGVYQTSLLINEDFAGKMRHSFQQAVKYVSKEAVKVWVMQSTDNPEKQEKFKTMKYRELCQHISGRHYTQCTQSVYERFWDVMYSHWSMIRHHVSFCSKQKSTGENDFLERVHEELLCLRKTVWDLIKRRVEHLLNFHLASCKVRIVLQLGAE